MGLSQCVLIYGSHFELCSYTGSCRCLEAARAVGAVRVWSSSSSWHPCCCPPCVPPEGVLASWVATGSQNLNLCQAEGDGLAVSSEACASCPHWSHLQPCVLAQGHRVRAKCPLRIIVIHFLEINPRDGKSRSIFLGAGMHFTLLGLFSLATSLGTKPCCIPEMPWSSCRELEAGRLFSSVSCSLNC